VRRLIDNQCTVTSFIQLMMSRFFELYIRGVTNRWSSTHGLEFWEPTVWEGTAYCRPAWRGTSCCDVGSISHVHCQIHWTLTLAISRTCTVRYTEHLHWQYLARALSDAL